MYRSNQLSHLDDRMIRWIGIPGFGILIPNFTGLFENLGPGDWWYWPGYGYFILISWCVWHGNRWLLFRQRENISWFSHPVRKLLMLVAANVFYTAPVSIGLLTGWYYLSGADTADWEVIRLATLANVICVIFVTHAYETVFLIKERQGDMLAFEQLERARVEAELQLLKSQIDPHFMFNSLNTLSYLIEHDRERALLFNESLSDVYRYILMNKQKELVALKEEIDFANSYFTLIRIRFGQGVDFRANVPETAGEMLIAPISLQLLLENAVKHNEFTENKPLHIDLRIDDTWVCMTNNRQPKPVTESSGIGLRNLQERYLLIMGRQVIIEQDQDEFRVKLPYLTI